MSFRPVLTYFSFWTLGPLNGLCFHVTCAHWPWVIHESLRQWGILRSHEELSSSIRSAAGHRSKPNPSIPLVGPVSHQDVNLRSGSFPDLVRSDWCLKGLTVSQWSAHIFTFDSLWCVPSHPHHYSSDCVSLQLMVGWSADGPPWSIPSWGCLRPSRRTPTPRRLTWESEPTGMTWASPLCLAASARFNYHQSRQCIYECYVLMSHTCTQWFYFPNAI